ncbi:SLIT-ROBO Rho GTPase-activating protein 1-like isoform X1 [Vespula squamosa]|uniref:SLIT-ROBO Rho GTPase-activating protein 1-like isoform X1 n=1 Tax=Vespula squamosa TaxID=30214 RepID=A0ABD1ZVB6_VESSQ
MKIAIKSYVMLTCTLVGQSHSHGHASRVEHSAYIEHTTCIIQQRNGWIHPYSPDTKDVFPEKRNIKEYISILQIRSSQIGTDVDGIAIGLSHKQRRCMLMVMMVMVMVMMVMVMVMRLGKVCV